MLRGECESCGNFGDNQMQVGALLGVAVKGVHCGKVTARFGQVCGDQRAVADDCRLKNTTKSVASSPVHPPNIRRAATKTSIASNRGNNPMNERVSVRIYLHHSNRGIGGPSQNSRICRNYLNRTRGSDFSDVNQQRNGGDKFCERRMLEDYAVVVASVPVACVNFNGFVDSLRFAPRRKAKFRRKNQQQQRRQRGLALAARTKRK